MNQINDSAIRTKLRTDIKAAWSGLKAIHDDLPRVEKDLANLPYVVIRLAQVTQVNSGLKKVEQALQYNITYTGKWSQASGANQSLEEAKVARANELMNQMLTTTGYTQHGVVRRVPTVLFHLDDPDAQTPVYRVTVVLEVRNYDDY